MYENPMNISIMPHKTPREPYKRLQFGAIYPHRKTTPRTASIIRRGQRTKACSIPLNDLNKRDSDK